jgi:hypothetical protein
VALLRTFVRRCPRALVHPRPARRLKISNQRFNTNVPPRLEQGGREEAQSWNLNAYAP